MCEFWKVKTGMERSGMEGFTFQNSALSTLLAVSHTRLHLAYFAWWFDFLLEVPWDFIGIDY